MSPFAIKSIGQRIFLFLLIPAAILLFSVGIAGFLLARNAILKEWKESSVLKLERAAHYIDMRLEKPIDWIKMFNATGGMQEGTVVQDWLIKEMRQIEGVVAVDLRWAENRADFQEPMMKPPGMRRSGLGRRGMMRFHRGGISEVTPPRYDTQAGRETVSLISSLKDESDEVVGELEVTLLFSHLLQDIQALGWWQSNFAGLVDNSGRYLANTQAKERPDARLGETGDPLEISLLKAIRKGTSGTLLGQGRPPERVCGFYKLKNAPWTMVLFAGGKEILQPVIRFRLYYFIASALGILGIILLIRMVTVRLARNIQVISMAAGKVAKGDYGEPLPVRSGDEIGQLTGSFNRMTEGLKERDFLNNTFGRFVDPEIAKEILTRPEASALGGQKREVAILMSDLKDFTPMSEALSPDVTIRILNRYFSWMINTVYEHKGIIVDFFGDALLVFFDSIDGPVAPVVLTAVKCATVMQQGMDGFNRQNRMEGLPELQMRVAVNAGEVIVGNIGSDTRAKYGIVGAPVNLTDRIQSAAGQGEVVISESAYRHGKGKIIAQKMAGVLLKGIQEPMDLYVVTAIQGEMP